MISRIRNYFERRKNQRDAFLFISGLQELSERFARENEQKLQEIKGKTEALKKLQMRVGNTDFRKL